MKLIKTLFIINLLLNAYNIFAADNNLSPADYTSQLKAYHSKFNRLQPYLSPQEIDNIKKSNLDLSKTLQEKKLALKTEIDKLTQNYQALSTIESENQQNTSPSLVKALWPYLFDDEKKYLNREAKKLATHLEYSFDYLIECLKRRNLNIYLQPLGFNRYYSSDFQTLVNNIDELKNKIYSIGRKRNSLYITCDTDPTYSNERKMDDLHIERGKLQYMLSGLEIIRDRINNTRKTLRK